MIISNNGIRVFSSQLKWKRFKYWTKSNCVLFYFTRWRILEVRFCSKVDIEKPRAWSMYLVENPTSRHFYSCYSNLLYAVNTKQNRQIIRDILRVRRLHDGKNAFLGWREPNLFWVFTNTIFMLNSHFRALYSFDEWNSTKIGIFVGNAWRKMTIYPPQTDRKNKKPQD